MTDFRLNRNVFKGQTQNQAADYREIYRQTDWKERLRIAAYLNSIAFKYDPVHPPAMNRSVFAAKSLKS